MFYYMKRHRTRCDVALMISKFDRIWTDISDLLYIVGYFLGKILMKIIVAHGELYQKCNICGLLTSFVYSVTHILLDIITPTASEISVRHHLRLEGRLSIL